MIVNKSKNKDGDNICFSYMPTGIFGQIAFHYNKGSFFSIVFMIIPCHWICDKSWFKSIDRFSSTTVSSMESVYMSWRLLQWRHNGPDGISNHQPHDCLLNCLCRRRSKKTSKLRVTGLCAGNSPLTGEFPAQMASNAKNYVNPGCGRSRRSPDLEVSIAPGKRAEFWLQWQLADTAWLACARVGASRSAAERPSNAPTQSHSLQRSHPHLNSIFASKMHARDPLHWVICIRLIRWHGAHLHAVVIVMDILSPDPEKLPSSLWSRNLRVLPKLMSGHVIAYAGDSYHGYAMRKILPLCIKTVTGKSKGFLCLFGHNSRIHCFWLKNQNLFSQNITFRVINYLNLVEKIIRNWNVDGVSVPIISKDIR